jgi:hypothetical protein
MSELRFRAEPFYQCRYTAEAPVIDGRLDDAVWRKAEPMFLVLTNTGESPRQPTTARALWTDTHLLVAFDCRDDDVWAGLDGHDTDIFNEEVVEVFIDENCDGKSYVELEVSPNNSVLDMYILNLGRGPWQGMRDYESRNLQTAVAVDGTVAEAAGTPDDRGWTVEMAIAFDDLVLARHHPPKAGDLMRWNLYRIDRPVGGKDEYSAWAPTGAINYHRPMEFGWLELTK